jgi:hypothetical protein
VVNQKEEEARGRRMQKMSLWWLVSLVVGSGLLSINACRYIMFGNTFLSIQNICTGTKQCATGKPRVKAGTEKIAMVHCCYGAPLVLSLAVKHLVVVHSGAPLPWCATARDIVARLFSSSEVWF